MQGALKTTSFAIGALLLLLVVTLEAVPAARDDLQNLKTSSESSNTDLINACATLMHADANNDFKTVLAFINYKQPNLSVLDQCAAILNIIMHPGFFTESLADEEPQRLEILEMLARLGQNMIRDDLENSKRGLGFGMDRGFSGQQAAKHLMGLHAATWPGGPGRRRRSDIDDEKRFSVDFGMNRGNSARQLSMYDRLESKMHELGKRSGQGLSEPEE